MRITDGLVMAVGAVAAQRRRTFFSLVGMAVGVAAVVVLAALGEGARGYVVAEFANIGADVAIVLPGKVETSGGMPGFTGVPNDLTFADAHALAAAPEVLRVAPLALGNETVSVGERSRQVMVIGASAAFREVHRVDMGTGSFLPEMDFDHGASVAVIGPKLGRELFGNVSPLGDVIRIGEARMRVIGVLRESGQRFGMDMGDTVIIPVATAMRLFNRSSLFRVLVQARPGRDLDRLCDRIEEVLRARHGEDDVTIITPDAILESLERVLSILSMALAGIAAISLVVAGIGIMNVMLVAVSERTREIGLMKALGASRGQILGLFLTETLVLALVGAGLGIGAGEACVWAALEFLPGLPFRIPTWALAVGTVLPALVGVVLGMVPARQALRLDPIMALSRGR